MLWFQEYWRRPLRVGGLNHTSLQHLIYFASLFPGPIRCLSNRFGAWIWVDAVFGCIDIYQVALHIVECFFIIGQISPRYFSLSLDSGVYLTSLDFFKSVRILVSFSVTFGWLSAFDGFTWLSVRAPSSLVMLTSALIFKNSAMEASVSAEYALREKA